MLRSFAETTITSRGAITIWLGYVLIAALIQYSLSHTLYTDDAMGSLLIQEFRIGYTIRNPPLWEWVLWTIQQGIGPGFESHWLLRYTCIALLGIAAFDASRAASRNVMWAAAVTLCLPLFYPIGWGYFLRNTYSLAVVIVCLFSLSVGIRYVARPNYTKAVLLGFLVGLGLLCKYNFAIFAIALFAALLILRDARAAIARRESLLIPVAALITISPFLYWLLVVNADLIGLTQRNLVTAEASHLSRIFTGLSRELELAVGFVLPWALIAAAAAWRGRYLTRTPVAPAGPGERLTGLTLLLGVGLTTAGIVVMGITKLNAAYMLPILIAAVPYSAARLSRAAPGPENAAPVAMIGVGGLVVILLLRLGYLSNSGFPENSQRRDMWPLAELATRMREAGLDGGTLVTVSSREGGNLRAGLPEVRVVTFEQADDTRPLRSTGHASACRLLWNATNSLYPDARWARSREEEKVASLPQVAEREHRHFDIAWPPSYLGTNRTSRWTIVELDPDDPLCR